MSQPNYSPQPEPQWEIPPECRPNVENAVTEDDTPVDNIFSEKQQRLLTESLYSSWRPGVSFVALANVGLFGGDKEPAIVPDMLLSLDTHFPEELWQKHHRSYFVWEYNKPPDLVIEIVSNKEGREADEKLQQYARMGVAYYVIFDPERQLSDQMLRIYKRFGMGYVETVERFFPELGLGLTVWQGTYETWEDQWLRWCDRDKQVIPSGAERAEAECERAGAESRRAENERRRAETESRRAAEAQHQAQAERERAQRLADKLRALGLDPDEEA